MKLVVPVRLYPGAADQAALRDTLTLCNQAAGLVSARAFEMRVTSRQSLQRLVYGDLKAMGLSAQPYDDRCLSWQLDRRTVSIWTVAGRPQMRFRCSAAQLARLRDHRQGESDLVHRDGTWYLYATCEVPEAEPTEPAGFLGVDLGIVNIATTDDGRRHSGKYLNRQRHRARHLRAKLQAKGTKAAKRLLKKRARKEARFAADVNHVIAKRIVTEAERTGRGIALEDLTGIRARVRLRKPQRVTLHSWAFAQLAQFIACKARMAGVAVVHVDPAYTSRMCSQCRHTSKRTGLTRPRSVARRAASLSTPT